MWRPQSFTGKMNDSDQSISDDDDEQDSPWPEKFVSLGGTFDRKKESLGVASQLELLKGVRQKDSGFSSEDEVEVPEFYNQADINRQCSVEGDSVSLKSDDSTCDVDEQLSNIQNGNKDLIKSVIARDNVSDTLNPLTRGKEKLIENCLQSAIYKESRRVDPSTETGKWPTYHVNNLKERNPSKGGSRKGVVARPASLVEPYKKGVFWSLPQTDKDQNSTCSDELQDESEAIDSWPKEKTKHFEDSHNEISKSRPASPVGTAMQVQHDNSKRSMVELLDHLQGKNNKAYQKCNTDASSKQRIRCHGMFQNLPSSLSNQMSDEDAGELMSSGSSTDNEDIAQDLRSDIGGSCKKTMADKFQEAFGSAPVVDPRPPFMAPKLLSSGLFGRLQQVMQLQKDQDIEFLKKQQTEVWPKDEARCIDVKILSRSFDAKLTACHCSLLENEESSVQNPHQECFQKTWTIIFNSRVCNDVDLEVGKSVRIHPPWKEVQVLRCGEIIILSTYFSQI